MVFGMQQPLRVNFCNNTMVLTSEIWCCATKTPTSLQPNIKHTYLPKWARNKAGFIKYLKLHALPPGEAIVVSHGCWQLPTRLAYYAHTYGYKWIATPQGMLEPWSMRQKALKKWLYYRLFERRWLRKADAIRAVSQSEEVNLLQQFKMVIRVPNGVLIPPMQRQPNSLLTFVFLGRLHHKKGVLPLVKAWHANRQFLQHAQLVIAGPDEGEWQKIEPFCTGNISYAGPLFGVESRPCYRPHIISFFPLLAKVFHRVLLRQWVMD